MMSHQMVKDVSKKFSTIEVLKSVVRRRPQGCGDDRWSIGSPGAVTLPFALRKMPSSEAFKAFSVLYVMKDHLVRGGKLSILFRICWKLQCTPTPASVRLNLVWNVGYFVQPSSYYQVVYILPLTASLLLPTIPVLPNDLSHQHPLPSHPEYHHRRRL